MSTGFKMSRLQTLKPKVRSTNTITVAKPATERITGYKLQKIRERIGLRDNYTCVDCKRVTIKGEVDHEIPLHLGGAESDENRKWRCPECHAKKSEREEQHRK